MGAARPRVPLSVGRVSRRAPPLRVVAAFLPRARWYPSLSARRPVSRGERRSLKTGVLCLLEGAKGVTRPPAVSPRRSERSRLAVGLAPLPGEPAGG